MCISRHILIKMDYAAQIESLYAAFSRRDTGCILNQLTDDVEWVVFGPPSVPFTGTCYGREAVQRALSTIHASQSRHCVAVTEILAAGDSVVATVRYSGQSGPYRPRLRQLGRPRVLPSARAKSHRSATISIARNRRFTGSTFSNGSKVAAVPQFRCRAPGPSLRAWRTAALPQGETSACFVTRSCQHDYGNADRKVSMPPSPAGIRIHSQSADGRRGMGRLWTARRQGFP